MKKRFLVCLMLLASAHADQWDFFHPESVIKVSCKVEETDYMIQGEARRAVFMAEAKADRKDRLGVWSMTLGIFPPTLKGRHGAERVCSKWMDEAGKRIKKAQGEQ
jgi:hypothetical protein